MIKSLEIRTIVHATEDEDKVLKALSILTTKKFKKLLTRGHFGQKIEVLYCKIKGDEAEKLLSKIVENIGAENILRRLDSSLNLWLRIDKQSAYHGRIEMTDAADFISIHVRFSGKSRERAEEAILRMQG